MSKELIRRSKKQDKESFSELMCQHKMSMYKIAKAILKNEEDVADAIQETILNCWEKISTLHKPEYFKTWLIRILINNCNAIYNKNTKVVLDLYYVEGFKVREIAEILQIGQSAVKGRLQASRKKLETYYSVGSRNKNRECS